ncbi:hypothetical protein [Streptomyces sp. NPDC007083]|uniref:hypothetical protein n=1 Tax=Streptomyces sp. NPDC007083 TaxID=3156913 RepID=UPI0033E297BA
MSLRSTVRDEFPHGWWRSPRWWFEGARQTALGCLTAAAPVLFAREAHRAVRYRDDPPALSSLKGSAEGYAGGLLLGCAGLGAAVALEIATPGWCLDWAVFSRLGLMSLWCLANVTVASTMLTILVRSRIRHRPYWEEVDFIDAHAPKHGRPPETSEEYRALRLKAEQ